MTTLTKAGFYEKYRDDPIKRWIVHVWFLGQLNDQGEPAPIFPDDWETVQFDDAGQVVLDCTDRQRVTWRVGPENRNKVPFPDPERIQVKQRYIDGKVQAVIVSDDGWWVPVSSLINEDIIEKIALRAERDG